MTRERHPLLQLLMTVALVIGTMATSWGIPAWASDTACAPAALTCAADEMPTPDLLGPAMNSPALDPIVLQPGDPVADAPIQEALAGDPDGTALEAINPAERVYTSLDAMTILLREGMECLLVITALLAFLNRSGHRDKSLWIWLGAGGGIVASVATAIALRVVFRSVLGDVDPDLLEGVTGLVAAGLLIYVSFWLHRQSAAGAWKQYIEAQTASVLAASSLFPLALIAFLSVYREGAETILLYMGMAPSISSRDLLSGLGMGTALLVLIAVLMLGLGLRIPLRPFFRSTSLLIFVLGFKFIGTGIHNLQEVGQIPLHIVEQLPTLKKLGIYPTLETALAQGSLLLLTFAVLMGIAWGSRSSKDSDGVGEGSP